VSKPEEANQNENPAEVVNISTPDNTSKRKMRRGPILLQLLAVAGFLAVVWFSFGQNVLAFREQLNVPERLGILQRVSSSDGPEAMARVDRLHGTDIQLTSAYIVEYVYGAERGTVWVGEAASSDDAVELTRRMVEAIAEGGSGFGNLQKLTIAGHEVFQVDGPGGQHFFYHSDRTREQVVWLIIDAADVLPILEQTLQNF
jgi:hypothetical protein